MGTRQSMFVGDMFDIKGQKVEVIEYVNSTRVKVRFDDGYEVYAEARNVRNEDVNNPFKPSVAGVGYRGVGRHLADSRNPVYNAWFNMIRRCYSTEIQTISPTYIGCTVTSEWWNFQVFGDWYERVFAGKENWELDKDLLLKGNKVYSPTMCSTLPHEINSLLIKSDKARGVCCIGVHWCAERGKFVAQLSISGGRKQLGRFGTELEAFLAYKAAKESFIKQQANKWRDQIDPRAYEALMNYQVEITD